MSIYDPLKKFLASSNQYTVRLTFSDIEKLLCRSLPQSAYTYVLGESGVQKFCEVFIKVAE